VALWDDDGLVSLARAPVACAYGPGGRVEQDPASWWSSTATACAAVRAEAPSAFSAVRALGFSAARQTVVPVAADGSPVGPALVWSDRRAVDEVAALAAAGGGADAVRRRTGIVLDAASVAAKVAWLVRHEPERMRRARWLLSPRDLLAWRMTGELCTDPTLASATGLYDTWSWTEVPPGDEPPSAPVAPLPELVGDHDALFPELRASASVTGALVVAAADELGLPVGVPVVIGAGDRACEVLGAGATPDRPMVSWGTTANVSVPVPASARHDAPDTVVVTRAALGGWLLEGGLSAAGSLVDWLARLTGIGAGELLDRAGASPPGGRGVTVLPWFGGARAPWWRDSARGAVVGLSLDHDAADLARAVLESVAWDVERCVASLAAVTGAAAGLALGGGGSGLASWVEVLTAVTGLPARRRRSGEAASAGAALVVAHAIGDGLDLDRLDPVVDDVAAEPSAVAAYRALRPSVDAAARAVIGLGADR
jgi:xylulokinase